MFFTVLRTLTRAGPTRELYISKDLEVLFGFPTSKPLVPNKEFLCPNIWSISKKLSN
jgi:hypothetical protein